MRLNSKTFLEAFLSLLIFFCSFSYALATEEYFAEPLVGHTTYYDGSTIRYYDGMGGNEVIFNHNPSTGLGFAESGYNPSFATTRYKQPAAANTIDACAVEVAEAPFSLTDVTRCFFLNLNSYKNFLMISRTSRNNIPGVEIAALIFDNVITGDVYNTGLDFTLYGRNLKANSNSMVGATWDAGTSYIINPNAQASYASNSTTRAAFDKHIAELTGESKDIPGSGTLASKGAWYLQSGTANIDNVNYDWAKTRPEGGVWKEDAPIVGGVPKLQLSSSTYKYYGKGTLLVNGDLFIEKDILKGNSDSVLGIIVNGNVSIAKNVKVEAAIMTTGNFTMGNNIELLGSFMSPNFIKEKGTSAQGIHIVYDGRLEDNWPPGFRYFNMPHAESATP